MADPGATLGSRNFSRVDARRAFISVAILAALAVCYWYMLPAVQALIVPQGAGGRTGPWVLRPASAARFCAMAVLSSVTFPVITWPLWGVWRREDAALGSRYVPFSGRPGKRRHFVFKGCWVLLIYASGLVFYLSSWTVIGPDGIEEHFPWGTRHHSFQDIESLETVPAGLRSDSIRHNGPWYSIEIRGGGYIELSTDNEGISPDELAAIASLVADRSGLGWVRRSDARTR